MWLINTNTLELEEFIGSDRPDYVILSHTWGEDEVLFSHVQAGHLRFDKGRGSQKIRKTCELAKKNGFEYAWVDTCCIDKSSSVELAEAINSMFQWYASAAFCYVYLEDLTVDAPTESFTSCRWFTRGWTLQELLATDHLIFFDQGWNARGTKLGLANLIEETTSINQRVLRDKDLLRTIPVAQKMSWAASRFTTRPEDIAYCLLGIFDINMALIYGEGRKKAFFRLQEEIMREKNDLSIFMWRSLSGEQKYRGILAYGPEEFTTDSPAEPAQSDIYSPEFAMTNKGVRINAALSYADTGDLVLCLYYSWLRSQEYGLIGVYLKAYGDGTYARIRPTELAVIAEPASGPLAQRYLSKEIYSELEAKLDSTRENAVIFFGPFETRHYRYEWTSPAIWWDHDNRVYLRDGNTSFVAFHVFSSEWDNVMEDSRFIIAFGVSNDGAAWVSHGSSRGDELFAAAIKGNMDMVESHGIARFKAKGNGGVLVLNRLGQVGLSTISSDKSSGAMPEIALTQDHWIFHLQISLSQTKINGYSNYCVELHEAQYNETSVLWLLILIPLIILCRKLQER